MTFSFLLWSPLTSEIKDKRLGEPDHPSRELTTNAAKNFIQDKFTDVVLYGGTYRDRILRPTVEKALCYFVGGSPNSDGKNCNGGDAFVTTVLITPSLGGYMLMDAIHEELTRGQKASTALNTNSAAYKVIRSTQLIYMMANQLALLDLTTLNSYPYPETSEQSMRELEERGESETGGQRMINNFVQEWTKIQQKRLTPSPERFQPITPSQYRQIVAFSDPNDILSYLVTPSDLNLPNSDPEVYLVNVYIANHEFRIPFLFSWPPTAHTGYFENEIVLDLLVCGMENGAVSKPCKLPVR